MVKLRSWLFHPNRRSSRPHFQTSIRPAIFNRATGFRDYRATMGEPAFVVANHCHAGTNFAEHPAGYLASSVLFRKVRDTDLTWDVDIDDILTNSYPETVSKAPV
jgi:hypothetical protein